METHVHAISDSYYDSVQLMRVVSEVTSNTAIRDADAMMGTAANLDRLRDDNTLSEQKLADIDPDDLLLVVRADSESKANNAIEQMITLLEQNTETQSASNNNSISPKSIRSASNSNSSTELALISVPGEYAGIEAWNALNEGLHVHLFSDNVPIDVERDLKEYGYNNTKLVMGPDCGTAIIDGLKLGFANEVPDGPIGIIAASGTGLQTVTSRLARRNVGTSQAVGVGSRDLSNSINGLTTRTALSKLDNDDATDVIVIISKPPGDSAIQTIEEEIKNCSTPVIIHFQGGESLPQSATSADTLAATADKAIELADVDANSMPKTSEQPPQSIKNSSKTESEQYIRGLFSGGTLCSEAALLLQRKEESVRTNVDIGDPVKNNLDPNSHTFIDFGVDELTESRPHPMIDPSLRNEWIKSAVTNESTSVVLIDVVLGYGAHEDPASAVAKVLNSTESNTTVVASVCGTDSDQQPRVEQVSILEDAGVIVAESNAEATHLAYQITSKLNSANKGGIA